MKKVRRSTIYTCKASKFFQDHGQSMESWEVRVSGRKNKNFYQVFKVIASAMRLKKLIVSEEGHKIFIYPGNIIDFRMKGN